MKDWMKGVSDVSIMKLTDEEDDLIQKFHSKVRRTRNRQYKQKVKKRRLRESILSFDEVISKLKSIYEDDEMGFVEIQRSDSPKKRKKEVLRMLDISRHLKEQEYESVPYYKSKEEKEREKRNKRKEQEENYSFSEFERNKRRKIRRRNKESFNFRKMERISNIPKELEPAEIGLESIAMFGGFIDAKNEIREKKKSKKSTKSPNKKRKIKKENLKQNGMKRILKHYPLNKIKNSYKNKTKSKAGFKIQNKKIRKPKDNSKKRFRIEKTHGINLRIEMNKPKNINVRILGKGKIKI